MATLVGTPQTTDYGFSDTRDAVTLPSGIQANDVIFFVLATANVHTIGTIPAGVSQIGTTQDSDAGGDSSTSVLYTIADGGEGATYDLGAIFSGAESGGVLAFAYRGLDTADLIESTDQSSTTGTDISGPSVTPANDNCLILQIAGTDPSTEPVFTPDASPVATDVFSGYIDTGLWGYVAVQSYEQTTAAAIALDGSFDISYNWAHFQVALNSASSGQSISSSPTTAFPGQSRTLTGTGFGATQGTGGVTIGGVAQTITAWSDASVTFTTVLGTNSYGTGKTLELTTDASTTDTATIELVADTASGFGVVTMSSPNTTDESSVAFNATPTVVTGDQFEWEDFNALGNLVVGADGFVESVDAEGAFRGRFWDATDSTWGAVESFTATVPDDIGPVITSVNVPNAGTYAIGDTLSFTVNWDEATNVTGTPRLPLTLGSGTRYADYASGTGTTALVFSYTVQEGDEDTDGIAVNTIDLNGGTITDANSNPATLTLNVVENTAGIIVDGIRPVVSVGNTTTSDTTPTVSGSAGDATSLTLVVTGIGTYNPAPSGGSWSQTLPESPLGEYSMTLDGTDAAGNTAVQASGTLNIIEQDSWPYGLGIKPSIPVTWDWGKRHPKTGMRVRLFKRGGQ